MVVFILKIYSYADQTRPFKSVISSDISMVVIVVFVVMEVVLLVVIAIIVIDDSSSSCFILQILSQADQTRLFKSAI